jgi:ATP-binding cassette subfamily B protein
MLPWVRRHQRKLGLGAALSVLVIGIRLSLPWLFRGLLEPLISSNEAHQKLSSAVGEPLLFGVLVFGLLVALGLVDYLMRLQFAQFAIGVVREVRAKALQSAIQIDPRIRPSRPGDLVARLVGDTARIKEGLKGFLVHVATNGLMLVGVSVVLLCVDATLGAIFAGAYAVIGGVVAYAATRVYRRMQKLRSKEGLLADSIHEAWQDDRTFAALNVSSGKHEATITRLQGRTTWAVHAIFGLAVLLLIWFGSRAVIDGTLSGADMLVFVLYALMTRAPIVQLARQGTRTGKILACVQRLEEVIRTGLELESAAALRALGRQVRIEGLKVYRRSARGKMRRLRVEELIVPAGSRMAIVGPCAAGKSTLLQLLAGTLRPQQGRVWWDDVPLLDASTRGRQERIEFLPQEPRWPRRPLWHLLGLPDPVLTPAAKKVLTKCGANRVIRRLPRGLKTEIASDGLADGERRDLLLGRALLGDASLILLDDPFRGLTGKQARRRLRALLAIRGAATVIIAAHRPPSRKLFDRVIRLEKGAVVFDGRPEQYIADKERASEVSMPAAPTLRVVSPKGGVS